jgi:tellurium resistance protein TerD
MTVSLSKGATVSLTKAVPGLTAAQVGLGWDESPNPGVDFDLDASALLLNAAGRVLSDQHFVFFNNLSSPDGSVVHTGDNLVGDADGDDEVINVNLAGVPGEVQRVIFAVTIYEAEARRQNFGMVRNAYIRVVDPATDRQIARYDLAEEFSVDTAMIFGELYRDGADWRFRAVGQGYPTGLFGIAKDHGVNV